jgi:hypothetical protein
MVEVPDQESEVLNHPIVSLRRAAGLLEQDGAGGVA